MIRRFKFIMTVLILLIVLTVPSFGNNDPNHLKVKKVAIINSFSAEKISQKAFNLINYYLEKYAANRNQVTIIPSNLDSNPEPLSTTLKNLLIQDYQLAAVVKHREHSIEIYDLSRWKRLWTLSNNDESDLETLFWILDESILTGIRVVSQGVHLGLVPGRNTDLGPNFPCSTIYKVLRQLPYIKVRPIALKKFQQHQNELDVLSKNSQLDFILFYESQELQLMKPLFSGSILEMNGNSMIDFKIRVESTKSGYLVHTYSAIEEPKVKFPNLNTQTQSDYGDYGHSVYLGHVADELANYLLVFTLTQFCWPQEKPLVIKLTKQRKYILRRHPNDLAFPKLDNTVLPDYAIRHWD